MVDPSRDFGSGGRQGAYKVRVAREIWDGVGRSATKEATGEHYRM